MPITIEIDHERQEVRATATGVIKMADIRSHLSEEEQRRGLAYRELIDASQATAAFSTADVWCTVDILKGLRRKSELGPTAIIVSDDLAYGMMRMLGILLGDVCELRPYRMTERAKAEEWLATASIATGQGEVS
jgi:hypothetical protein